MLSNCPIFCGVSPRLEGFVEGLFGHEVKGWAWTANAASRVCLDVIVDGTTVGLVYATDYREDLHGSGIGDGAHGFAFRLPPRVIDGGIHRIEVRYHETQDLLPGGQIEAILDPAKTMARDSQSGRYRIGTDSVLRGHGSATSSLELLIDGNTFATVPSGTASIAVPVPQKVASMLLIPPANLLTWR